MITLILVLAYMSGFSFILGLFPLQSEYRPTLGVFGLEPETSKRKANPGTFLRKIALINKPICVGTLRQRITKDLVVGHVNITPEEFILAKELGVILALVVTYPSVNPDLLLFWIFMCFLGGLWLPELWLKGKIRRVKSVIIKELPDAIDLLALCVNAGLDFMLALKWVVEKSTPSVMVSELNAVLQEISVGKTRRDAIRDLAKRFEIPELSTFARTLIQADKMGTSVTEALNILSEDMRVARFRRGEQLALKAPLKLLIPLLVFIFPVVGVLVAGPILLDFIENNPFQSLGR